MPRLANLSSEARSMGPCVIEGIFKNLVGSKTSDLPKLGLMTGSHGGGSIPITPIDEEIIGISCLATAHPKDVFLQTGHTHYVLAYDHGACRLPRYLATYQ